MHIAAKAKDGARKVSDKAIEAAGALTRTVAQRFRPAEDDPLVPDLVAKAMQRLRAAFTHSDVEEMRDAIKNGVRHAAVTDGSGTPSRRRSAVEVEVAAACLLDLVWAGETMLGRIEADAVASGKKVEWLYVVSADAARASAAKATEAGRTRRKGAGRLIEALRAVLKDGNAKSMVDCATFVYDHFIFRDDDYAREQLQEHPSIESLAFAARAFGRRMLEGQFGCAPDPDALNPDETRVMERYLRHGTRPQPSSWDEVTAVTTTYRTLLPRLAARIRDEDVLEELRAFVAHDATEFPLVGEMRVLAALATLCGHKEVTEWGVKALVACLERPAADPATKAMWKKLKAFTCLDSSKGDAAYLPARLGSLLETPLAVDVCEAARAIAQGVTAENAAGVLRLRDFLWALLGREHLKTFEAHHGDDGMLAEGRYVMGMVRPQPTNEAEVGRFEKIFNSLAYKAHARMVGEDVIGSMRRVMEMRRGVSEDVERIVLAALLACGDDEVLSALPTRDEPCLGTDMRHFTLTSPKRRSLWELCVKKLDPDVENGTPAKINALGSKPLHEVDLHRLEMARELLVNAVDPRCESLVNGEPFVLALLTSTWIAMCQIYLAGFRAQYLDFVVTMEREYVLMEEDAGKAEALAAKCATEEEVEVTLTPFRVLVDMAARRFVSNDFKSSCRQALTLENPPPSMLRVLAALFVLAGDEKIIDHLPPLGMVASGTMPLRSPARGRAPAPQPEADAVPQAADEEELGPGPVTESVGGSGRIASYDNAWGPISHLTAGERGALWDAIRLAIDMDPSSDNFFPTRLTSLATGQGLLEVPVAAARTLVRGVTADELNNDCPLGAGLLFHVRCVLAMNPLKVVVAPPDTVATDMAAVEDVMANYLDLGIKARPQTAGEAARLLPVFETLAASTAAAFFEKDVTREMLNMKTAKKVSDAIVRLMAAVTVIVGAYDVIGMLQDEPGLIECADEDDKSKLWSVVCNAIEMQPERPSFLPKELETCASNVTAGILIPPDRLAIIEALAAGVNPKTAAKDRLKTAACAHSHVWCMLGLHSVLAFTQQ